MILIKSKFLKNKEPILIGPLKLGRGLFLPQTIGDTAFGQVIGR
jgi:hypothetical protein